MNKVTRRLVIALAVSAALNISLAGFVTARLLLGGRPRYGPPVHEAGPRSPTVAPPRSGHRIREAGPRGRRSAFRAKRDPDPMRRLMREHEKQFRPQTKTLRDARQRVAQALQAEPFDTASLKIALADLRQATNESQLAIHQALVEVAGSLTLQQRRKLSKSRLLRLSHGKPPH